MQFNINGHWSVSSKKIKTQMSNQSIRELLKALGGPQGVNLLVCIYKYLFITGEQNSCFM